MTGTSFDRLDRAPAYRVVEARIRSQIVGGTILEGSYLPTEQDLADQLGVTRQTVREAIRSLENAGLVERGKQRRLRVARPSHQALQSSHSEALLLHGITYRELWEFEMALDPDIAGLAAERCTPDMAERLQANLDQTKSVLSDPEALTQVDIEFHSLVAEATDNKAIQLARAPIMSLLFPAYAAVIRSIDPGNRLLRAHTRVVAAIVSGDSDEAAEWMGKHIRDFRRGCEMVGLDFDAPVQRV